VGAGGGEHDAGGAHDAGQRDEDLFHGLDFYSARPTEKRAWLC
jgi:hypothetical protein